MGKLPLIVLFFYSLILLSEQQYAPNWTSFDTRPLPRWYDESKIGIFLHWGLYSVISVNSEWFWWNWKGTAPYQFVLDYMEKYYPPDWTYANFGPQFRADLYDPDEWADLFAASGAKYVVLTSKHHEGYAMWPSTYSFNWNSMDVGPKRDLVGELATSIRNRTNIVFGLYYSLLEWFNPVFLKDKANNFTTQYFVDTKTLPELREIVEKYRPEVVWADGDWESTDIYWKSTEFLAWLYNDSPVKDTVVVNDRWGVLCRHGDFFTCADRYNPGHLIAHKWENCFTVDKGAWAFRPDANIEDYMTIEELLEEVIITISTGGNALVNVGPNMHGKIPAIFQERLRQMGSWLQVNGEGIYATVPWTYQNDTINPDVWYTLSKDGRFVYAFLLRWPNDDTAEIILGAPVSASTTVVTLLGSNGGSLPWRAASVSGGIVIDVSNVKLNLLASEWVWTFKLENSVAVNITESTVAGNITAPTVAGNTTEPTRGQGSLVSFHSTLLFSALLYLFYVRM